MAKRRSTPTDTDVVILCGGMGTRLREVVTDVPKPMAAIGGKPFLQLLVEHVASFGFRRFVLCAGYKAEAIEAWCGAGEDGRNVESAAAETSNVEHRKSMNEDRELSADKRGKCAIPAGLEVVVSREESPLGTGGALWNAMRLINGETFLVLNGDSFCAVDYHAFMEYHVARPAMVTVAVTELPDTAEYGTIDLDECGRIVGFAEKTGVRQSGLVNAGVYAFERLALDESVKPAPFSLERDVFPRIAARGALFGWKTPGPLLDIGTPERYREAQLKLMPMIGRAN